MPAITRPTVAKYSERGIRELVSPVESFAPGSSATTRDMRCGWVDRFKAARSILGYSTLEYNGSNEIIGLRRLTPMPHPDLQVSPAATDGPGNMWAMRINSIKPARPTGSAVSTYDSAGKIGGSALRSNFIMADINVQYENPGYSCLTEDEIGGAAFTLVNIQGTVYSLNTAQLHITVGTITNDWVGKTLTITTGTATHATYVITAVDISTARVTLNKSAGTAGQTVTAGTVDDAPGDWSTREFERYTRILEPLPSSEYITMPGGTLAYLKSGGGGPTGRIAQNVGKIFQTIQYKLLWKRLPFGLFSLSNPTKWQKRIWGDPDSLTTLPLIGTVNKLKWNGFAPGTVLFENCRPIPVDSMFNYVYEWDFEFTLHVDINGWNRKYYFPPKASGATDAGWYYVGKTTYYAQGSVPDGESIYNERDFSLLCDVRDIPPYL